MTRLSVNINKIALLRNARGRNYPDVRVFSERCLDLGAHGITLHPRPDQRHARYADIAELNALCRARGAELNVEGYPSAEFLAAVIASPPHQCTLVPDAPGQVTSDHGWDLRGAAANLEPAIHRLKDHGIRVSVFVDHDTPELAAARDLGADRVELYTEPYTAAFERGRPGEILGKFRAAAEAARAAELGVNAGHDLNLRNLEAFLAIPGILEVSIGHALVVEAIELGIPAVVGRYVEIVGRSRVGAPAGAAPGVQR